MTLTYEELERLAYMANDPVARVYGELDDAQQTIEVLEQRVGELTTQVEELTTQVEELTTQVEELTTQVDELEQGETK